MNKRVTSLVAGIGLVLALGGCLLVGVPEPRLWLKFPTTWPLGPEFPAHMGYTPSQDTPILIEAEA